VNDRGPFVKGRVIDLSYAAAKKLGIDVSGTAFVKIEALGYRQEDAGVKNKDVYKEPTSYDSGNYTIQVGAFRDSGNANRLSAEMRKIHGFADIQTTNIGGSLFYRVYAGKYTSIDAAEDAEKKFVETGFEGSFVVSLD